MAICGLPIPVTQAKLPLFDDVFVDVGDEQSIEQSLSTFSSHMKRLVFITQHATKNSLVIIDEICSGTDPKEGESLAEAILTYLHKKGAYILASTHYSALKEFAKEAKARGILYVVIKDKVNPDQTEVMVFADDAAKMNRVLDRMNLDFVKAESGSMVTEAVEKENAPEKAENQMEKETGENVRTETVVLPEGKIEFELDDAEEMFQIGDEAFPEGNFTHAQEGKAKNPSEPFSRNKNISSGRETSWEEKNEKPSVRKELGDIRKEQEEKRKRPDRRKNARESRKKRKNMKTKGR